jgi:hypothetical protein
MSSNTADHTPLAVLSIDGIPVVQCSCTNERKPTSYHWLATHWQGSQEDGVAALNAVVARQLLGHREGSNVYDLADAAGRLSGRVPAPQGEPEITMSMDSDSITFRDQAALDAHVAEALDAALAPIRALVETWEQIDATIAPVLGHPPSGQVQAFASQLRAALPVEPTR